jgi:hypothetical protein
MQPLKLYIAVLDEVPDHMVPVIVAHAMLRAHQKFNPSGLSLCCEQDVCYDDWYRNSFRKVVLKVNRREFFKIKDLEDVCLTHENSTLDGEDCCAVLCPREEYPNVIKFARMWMPNANAEIAHLRQELANANNSLSAYFWKESDGSFS